MDFDSERQLFELSEQETALLNLHPAWGVCPRERAASLYAYVVRQAAISFDMPRWPLQRQLAAREAAQMILAQLEPFIDEDAQGFAQQASQLPEPPASLE